MQEAKDNGCSEPVKPHPKVTMPARMITGAIRNISSRAAATGAQAESEAGPQTGRAVNSAAAAVDGTYVPTAIIAADTHLDLFDSESEDASDFEELIEVQANG